MYEWIVDNWKAFLVALPMAGVFGYVVSYFKYRWSGSRRANKNWKKTMELFGQQDLLKLGTKRINPDTIDCEGDAASVYYQCFTSQHYETVGGVRFCYERSFVVEVYAYFQWETSRGLGDNLMTQFASQPYPCTGLEEKKDAKGESYWVKVPVADKFISAEKLNVPHTSKD